MALSPVALKGLIGFGAVSTVALGGTYMYTKVFTDTSEINQADTTSNKSLDDLAFSDNSTHLTWSTEVVDTTSLNIKGIKDEKTWTCKIKGTRTNPGANETIGIKIQVETALGIKNDGTIETDKKEAFKKFIENCKRHRETNPDTNGSNSTIDLGELKQSGNEYKFEEEILKRIYEGEYWTQKLKEKQLGLNCSEGSGENIACTLTDNSLNGFTKKNSAAAIKVVKNTHEDPKRFPGGAYVVTETNDNDGNYKIEQDTNVAGGFKLTKVIDLKKSELCQKVKLTCGDEECTSTCQIQTTGDGWTTNIFKDSGNYAKNTKVTGTDSVTIETLTNDNSGKYYGKHKFKFSGSPTIVTQTTGSALTIDSNTNFSIKYVPIIGDYAFVQISET